MESTRGTPPGVSVTAGVDVTVPVAPGVAVTVAVDRVLVIVAVGGVVVAIAVNVAVGVEVGTCAPAALGTSPHGMARPIARINVMI
jgi:hypothetical protein